MTRSTPTPPTGHPIPAAVGAARSALGEVVDAVAWSLDEQQTTSAIGDLHALIAQAQELQARLVAQAVALGVPDDRGLSCGVWLARSLTATRQSGYRTARLSKALATHPMVGRAMARGEVTAEQAEVICPAVDALPDQPELRARATEHLVALAEHHDAAALKILGRRIIEVVDPEAADAAEAEALEREERQQAGRTRFGMREHPDGTWHGRFVLPGLEGEMLRKALMGLASPKHVRAEHGAGAYDHTRPTPHRLGEAFAAYVRGYPVDRLPDSGGLAATVVVTMNLDTLLGGLAAATTDAGTRLSPGLARHLACQAGIVPVVLDGASQVLDVGRAKRLHTKAMRIALAIEQRQCQHPGCTVPASCCHVHHPTPWSQGGGTSLRNARLLCPHHHALAHRETTLRT